jgi:hypothetical protein
LFVEQRSLSLRRRSPHAFARRNDGTHDRYLSAFTGCIDKRGFSSRRCVAMAAVNIAPGRCISECLTDRVMASGQSKASEQSKASAQQLTDSRQHKRKDLQRLFQFRFVTYSASRRSGRGGAAAESFFPG